MTDDNTSELVARWQQGDQQAAAELFGRYAARLIGLARSHLSVKLAHRIDPEDVVQSAYRSFFVGAREGRYALRQGSDLWRLLVVMMLRKLHHQVRRNTALRRSAAREESLRPDGASDGLEAQILSREPTPIEAVSLVDEVEALMRRRDPLERRVLELRLQGYNLEEIANQTQHTQYTVRRILDAVKKHLERLLQTGDVP
jgi:RNA polymerase sigma-70 factor (ECF subfamily)